MRALVYPGLYRGSVKIPGSKSDAQRAILAAGLAKGRSQLENIGISDDVRHLLAAITDLGAKVSESGNMVEIDGTVKLPNEACVNVGESGLAFRLMCGLAAVQNGVYTIEGTGSLLSRSQSFLSEFYPNFGVDVALTNGCAPAKIHGPIEASELLVDGSASSQHISGMLMALPLLSHDSVLKVGSLNSRPYVNMTLETLAKFGIDIDETQKDVFNIRGNQSYNSSNYPIEGDWSAASYWIVAAALGAKVSLEGLNMNSFQADKTLLDVMELVGCQIDDKGALNIQGKAHRAFQFDATHCPDLFPALAVLAAGIVGQSSIYGTSRLAQKESDRASVLQSEMAKLGVHVELLENEMVIHGTGVINEGAIDSHNDHRIAMCFAVAGMFADGPVVINEAEAVTKSYPEFWKDLESIAQNSSET